MSPAAVETRRVEPGDAEGVARLVQGSFRPEDLELTVYGCAGIAEYLRLEFQVPPAFSASTYLVAEANGSIDGFIELRASAAGLCVSYIVTASGRRSSGLGRKLLEAALAAADPLPGSELALDVFAHNDLARAWYTRLGFRTVRELSYWQVEAIKGQPASDVEISGMPQAEAAQDAFGFSSLTLTHRARTFSIGRLGRRWFRITDAAVLRSEAAMAALSALDPAREILLYASAESIDCALRCRFTPLLKSIRMACRLPLLAGVER